MQGVRCLDIRPVVQRRLHLALIGTRVAAAVVLFRVHGTSAAPSR